MIIRDYEYIGHMINGQLMLKLAISGGIEFKFLATDEHTFASTTSHFNYFAKGLCVKKWPAWTTAIPFDSRFGNIIRLSSTT